MCARKKKTDARRRKPESKTGFGTTTAWRSYQRACKLAVNGHRDEARAVYTGITPAVSDTRLKALIENDLAVLDVLEGNIREAGKGFSTALSLDQTCVVARMNAAEIKNTVEPSRDDTILKSLETELDGGTRVAILSFLFNWPSTGGGIIHTVELAKFLEEAGYSVKHFYARYDPWSIGAVAQSLSFESECIEFDDQAWTGSSIQNRYRQAVDQFDPDYVIVTDAWNFKPLLAEAVSGYPYILRQQALECLCPLNNLRFLVEPDGTAKQCAMNQLAFSEECTSCLQIRAAQSGRLHQMERIISGVGSPGYLDRLRRVLKGAEAILVLNPVIEALLAPYGNARVVTWGMDTARFPWPWAEEPERISDRTTLLMAGVIEEFIKGYHVIEEACRKLWDRRRDFELLVTAEPIGRRNDFTRNIGWKHQHELPAYLRAADIVVMPTIAQEGLGRTTVEAMAVGRPVIASRIGGLPYTVQDGSTGLLCEPGDPADLACKIEQLLDNPLRREQMGVLGRRRFEDSFTWGQVIEQGYRPLLSKRQDRGTKGLL